jgi:SOS-response transcriptional repressor LexA
MIMPKKRLEKQTQRQYEPLDVLAFIVSYREQHGGWSPSERQIQKALGISVPSVVHGILRRLEGAELLTITRYGRGHQSQLIPTEAGRTAALLWQEGRDSPDTNTSEGQK